MIVSLIDKGFHRLIMRKYAFVTQHRREFPTLFHLVYPNRSGQPFHYFILKKKNITILPQLLNRVYFFNYQLYFKFNQFFHGYHLHRYSPLQAKQVKWFFQAVLSPGISHRLWRAGTLHWNKGEYKIRPYSVGFRVRPVFSDNYLYPLLHKHTHISYSVAVSAAPYSIISVKKEKSETLRQGTLLDFQITSSLQTKNLITSGPYVDLRFNKVPAPHSKRGAAPQTDVFYLNQKSEIRNRVSKQIQNLNAQNSKQMSWSFGFVSNFDIRISDFLSRTSHLRVEPPPAGPGAFPFSTGTTSLNILKKWNLYHAPFGSPYPVHTRTGPVTGGKEKSETTRQGSSITNQLQTKTFVTVPPLHYSSTPPFQAFQPPIGSPYPLHVRSGPGTMPVLPIARPGTMLVLPIARPGGFPTQQSSSQTLLGSTRRLPLNSLTKWNLYQASDGNGMKEFFHIVSSPYHIHVRPGPGTGEIEKPKTNRQGSSTTYYKSQITKSRQETLFESKSTSQLQTKTFMTAPLFHHSSPPLLQVLQPPAGSPYPFHVRSGPGTMLVFPIAQPGTMLVLPIARPGGFPTQHTSSQIIGESPRRLTAGPVKFPLSSGTTFLNSLTKWGLYQAPDNIGMMEFFHTIKKGMEGRDSTLQVLLPTRFERLFQKHLLWQTVKEPGASVTYPHAHRHTYLQAKHTDTGEIREIRDKPQTQKVKFQITNPKLQTNHKSQITNRLKTKNLITALSLQPSSPPAFQVLLLSRFGQIGQIGDRPQTGISIFNLNRESAQQFIRQPVPLFNRVSAPRTLTPDAPGTAPKPRTTPTAFPQLDYFNPVGTIQHDLKTSLAKIGKNAAPHMEEETVYQNKIPGPEIPVNQNIHAPGPGISHQHPANVDIDGLTDRVYRMLEDKIRMEKEMRGW